MFALRLCGTHKNFNNFYIYLIKLVKITIYIGPFLKISNIHNFIIYYFKYKPIENKKCTSAYLAF